MTELFSFFAIAAARLSKSSPSTYVENLVMWSHPRKPLLQSLPAPDNSTLLKGSEIFQPFKNGLILTPGSLARTRNGFDFVNSLSLHIEINGGVPVRRAWARMTEPLTDG